MKKYNVKWSARIRNYGDKIEANSKEAAEKKVTEQFEEMLIGKVLIISWDIKAKEITSKKKL